MKWESLFTTLKTNVGAGEVTTYKELSNWLYRHPNGTQAVVAMLKAAVNSDESNALVTNRVVPVSGKLANVNGQTEQLVAEGIAIKDGKINWSTTAIVKFQ